MKARTFAVHKFLKYIRLDAASQNLYTQTARERAIAAAVGFGAVGVLAATFFVRDWSIAWPLVFFYAILVANTYFSVRVFSTITPAGDSSQKYIDFVITCVYLFLATQFERPLGFTITAAMLFIVCIAKYKLLRETAPAHKAFLERKITLDWLGALLCTLAMLGIVAQYPHISTILFAAINALANAYLLAIKPFYMLS